MRLLILECLCLGYLCVYVFVCYVLCVYVFQLSNPPPQSAPSANMQAQFSAAAGQQPMLYYRLPTGEFVAVPASALQGMQLSAAPPQGAAAAPSVNPFGQQ